MTRPFAFGASAMRPLRARSVTSPLVSVIVPVWNAAATLATTFASVRAQSFTRFEVIAVDDGSTDGSLALLRALVEIEPRLRVVSQTNAGVAAARNLGAELARAPLLAFLDADDLWDTDKLARHVAAHRCQPELAASYARTAFLDAGAPCLSAPATVSQLATSPLVLADVIAENPVCTTSNFVISRAWFERVGGFDRSMRHAEDQDIVARLIGAGARVEGIDAVLTGYRLSENGLSMDLAAMLAGWQAMAQRHLTGPAMAAAEARYFRYLARRALRGGAGRWAALAWAVTGLRRDARSFLADRRRGWSTLIAAMAAPFLPALLCRRVFR